MSAVYCTGKCWGAEIAA